MTLGDMQGKDTGKGLPEGLKANPKGKWELKGQQFPGGGGRVSLLAADEQSCEE